jgi:hypothetical protein
MFKLLEYNTLVVAKEFCGIWQTAKKTENGMTAGNCRAIKGEDAGIDVKQVNEVPVAIYISVLRKLAVEEPEIAGVESDIQAFCVIFCSENAISS